LVVNAGGVLDGFPMGVIADISEENYDKYMDLNLKSAYFIVQKSLPYLNDGASISSLVRVLLIALRGG
jgi:NAD(P)-dependent dehydrogenase (short-subunit alcohol dehydrogenase family)